MTLFKTLTLIDGMKVVPCCLSSDTKCLFLFFTKYNSKAYRHAFLCWLSLVHYGGNLDLCELRK